jgi:outer membrane protein assembly factor BamB
VGTTAFVACDDGTLRAIDTDAGQLLWKVECGSEFDAPPGTIDGVVYAGTLAGELFAVEATTGTVRWRLHLSDAAIETLPAFGDGRIYCATADGVVHTVSAMGHSMGTVNTGAQVRGAPVATPGRLFFGAEDGRLYSSDGLQSHEVVYDTGRGRRISVPLCLAYPFLLFTATGGELFALRVAEEGT